MSSILSPTILPRLSRALEAARAQIVVAYSSPPPVLTFSFARFNSLIPIPNV